jgi:aryl-alcohol dehydrogenase-like predicted oxidoreductase
MRTKTLGRTGLRVSELALGGLFTSQYGGTFDQSQAAILKALDLGINYIDTAPAYFDSEKVIGKALKDTSTPLIISTKLGGRPLFVARWRKVSPISAARPSTSSSSMNRIGLASMTGGLQRPTTRRLSSN